MNHTFSTYPPAPAKAAWAISRSHASRLAVQAPISRAEAVNAPLNFALKLPDAVPLRLFGGAGFVYCDREDFARLSQHRWQLGFFHGQPRVFARIFCEKVMMHRFILPVEGRIRFKDGNHLNLTKANFVTAKEVCR